MKIRCVHCHERFEVDPEQSLDAVTCESCGSVFSLLGDTVVDSQGRAQPKESPDSDEETRHADSTGRGTTVADIDIEETFGSLPADDQTTRENPDNTDAAAAGETIDYRLEPGGGAHKPSLQQLGKFELIKLLGSGSFGSVWQAYDKDLDRTVAVKVPRGWRMEPREIDQFLREARAAAQLNHANIVGILEIGRQDDIVYIVSELITGTTMQEWASDQQRTPKEIVPVCIAIADALHHAHEARVVHRDLKPANILMDEEGVPFITDFGLAKREDGEVTLTVEGQIVGSPAYMSPEQAQGLSHQADRRSDIYSLGVVLYNLLTGELPFRGNISMLIRQIVDEEAPPLRRLNNHVPRDLEVICLKCLQKEPDRRYQTAAEIEADLQRWNDGEAIHARPVSRIEKVWRFCKRKPMIASLSGTTVLFILITIIVSLAGWKGIADKHRESQNHLYDSEVSRAQFARQSFQAGHKIEALDAIGKAVAIKKGGSDLRDELGRILDLAELSVEREITPQEWDESGHSLFGFRSNGGMIFAVNSKTPIEVDREGKPTRRMDAIGPMAHPMCVSRDGNLFAGVSQARQQLEIWDLENESKLATLGKKEDFNKKFPLCVVFSADGKQLALSVRAINRKSRPRIRRFDLLAKRWIPEEPSLQLGWIESIQFSPDGKWMAACVGDKSLAIWKTSDPKTVRHLHLLDKVSGHVGGPKPNLVAFSPNNRWVAVACVDGFIRRWDLSEAWAEENAKPFSSIAAHQNRVDAVVFSRDNRVMVSKSQQELRIWDAHSGRLLVEQLTRQPSRRIELGPDNILLTSGSQSLTVWRFDLPLAKTLFLRAPGKGVSRFVLYIEFDESRNRVAVAGVGSYCTVVELDDPFVKVDYLPSTPSGERLVFEPHRNVIWCGTSSPYGLSRGLCRIDVGHRTFRASPVSRRLIGLTMVNEQLITAMEVQQKDKSARVEFRTAGKLKGHIQLPSRWLDMGGEVPEGFQPHQFHLSGNGSHVAVMRTRPKHGIVSVFDVKTGTCRGDFHLW